MYFAAKILLGAKNPSIHQCIPAERETERVEMQSIIQLFHLIENKSFDKEKTVDYTSYD